MRLPDLFHWSPSDNYRSIMDEGLQLHQPARGVEEFRPGYISVRIPGERGPSPVAWNAPRSMSGTCGL